MLFPGKHVGLSMYGSIFFEMYMFEYICIWHIYIYIINNSTYYTVYIYTRVYIHTPARKIHARTLAFPRTHLVPQAHKHTNAHTNSLSPHTYTHEHTHTYSLSLSLSLSLPLPLLLSLSFSVYLSLSRYLLLSISTAICIYIYTYIYRQLYT